MKKRIWRFLKHDLAGQVVASFLFLFVALLISVSVVQAVTTVSTDVVTDGNLQASSTLLVTGAVLTYGDATFGNAAADIYKYTGQLHASTTSLFTSGLTTYGDSLFGDATTDITKYTGQLHASTTALFTNGISLFGNLILENGETIRNGTNNVVSLEGTTIAVATTSASTTAGSLWVAAPAGTATSSVQLGGNITGATGSGTKGSCIQMWREGVLYRMFLSTTTTNLTVDGTFLKIETGSCRD